MLREWGNAKMPALSGMSIGSHDVVVDPLRGSRGERCHIPTPRTPKGVRAVGLVTSPPSGTSWPTANRLAQLSTHYLLLTTYYLTLTKVYLSSWKSGSSGMTMMGFCWLALRMRSGTYFLSTTSRKAYSLNQSLVMMIYPL